MGAPNGRDPGASRTARSPAGAGRPPLGRGGGRRRPQQPDPRPPAWPGQGGRCWCWSGASALAAPAPWSSPSPTPASWSAFVCLCGVGLLDQTVVDELGLEATTATRCSSPTPTSGSPSPTAPQWPSSSTATGPWPTCAPTASPSATSRGCWPLRGPVRPAAPGPADRPRGDTWQGDAPTREAGSQAARPRPRAALGPVRGVDRRLALDRYVVDRRMKDALCSQGSSAPGWPPPGHRLPSS